MILMKTIQRKAINIMYRLTERERQVALLVQEGLSNKEIANLLYVSTHTVKSELEHIYEKLQLRNRVQLAIYALKYELESKV